jgi:hypothetical protein
MKVGGIVLTAYPVNALTTANYMPVQVVYELVKEE